MYPEPKWRGHARRLLYLAIAAVIGAVALQVFSKVIEHEPQKLVIDAKAGQCSGKLTRAALLCEVNAVRRANGLHALSVNGSLRVAAQRHAEAMAGAHFFAHTDPEGRGPAQRAQAAGYTRGVRAWHVGEALAYGTGPAAEPREVLKGWMRSPPHRAIVLDRTATEGGGGIAIGLPVGGQVGTGLTYVLMVGHRQRTPRTR